MTHRPRIPEDQRSFADRGPQTRPEGLKEDRRDKATGVQSPEPGDADVNLDQEGRFGNLKQNTVNRWRVSDH
jgi:hypothetical protein